MVSESTRRLGSVVGLRRVHPLTFRPEKGTPSTYGRTRCHDDGRVDHTLPDTHTRTMSRGKFTHVRNDGHDGFFDVRRIWDIVMGGTL